MENGFDLGRFVAAQEGVYEGALAELEQGRKQGHWMWFVFPQLRGLGRSSTALFYGIGSAAEARAYLDHGLLGPRLIAATMAVLAHRGLRAEAILGSVDALKLRSSMTLFEAVAPDPQPFAQLIEAFYRGERDRATLEMLRGWA